MKSCAFSPILRLLAALLGPVFIPASAADLQDTVMRAMRDELARSMAELQFGGLEKPYFISYRIRDNRSGSVSAKFGATFDRGENHSRSVWVIIRVGSPAFDNTNFQSASGSSAIGDGATLPTDDNYDVLRRQLWLVTDRAYKQAVEQLAKKRAVLQNKTRTDQLPDFTPQPPATITDLQPAQPIDLGRAEDLVRDLSAVFRESPDIAVSSLRLSAQEETIRYLNSEGSAIVRSEYQLSLGAFAATQAPDGFSLDDHYLVFARSWEGLPPKAELLSAVRDLARRVQAQRQASLLDHYTGPVLFEGQAAVEVFAQVFAPLLGARPRPVVEPAPPGARSSSTGVPANPFLDKLGARVLPDFFTVTDNPTLTEVNGVPVFGDVRVDDEGVPSRPVTLVEKGRLKTLLVSRAPVRGVSRSTGSHRNGSPQPSNVLVTAADGLDPAALKAELLKLVEQRGKEFGVIIRRLADPQLRSGSGGGRGSSRVEPAVLAVKVLPDGREEPLRNIEIAGIEPPSFKDILVAGRDPYVCTLPFRSTVCSFAVPSLLFEDLTLKKPAAEISRPPIAKHPFFDR